jgi:hypothetical protein
VRGLYVRLKLPNERGRRPKMNSLSDWVALVAAIEVTALAAFQILLAAGLPLGAAAFGGSNAVLPSTPSANSEDVGR